MNGYYYSVVIPFVPEKYRTRWHPNSEGWEFSTISRGTFNTVEEAIEWAKHNLMGTPYTIKKYFS